MEMVSWTLMLLPKQGTSNQRQQKARSRVLGRRPAGQLGHCFGSWYRLVKSRQIETSFWANKFFCSMHFWKYWLANFCAGSNLWSAAREAEVSMEWRKISESSITSLNDYHYLVSHPLVSKNCFLVIFGEGRWSETGVGITWDIQIWHMISWENFPNRFQTKMAISQIVSDAVLLPLRKRPSLGPRNNLR